MDNDFVRGAETTDNDDGALLTSRDGFNCYQLITYEYSRHLWVFLFADKNSHIDTIALFLENHDSKHGIQWVRTDQCGELEASTAFRKCVIESGFILETTGTSTSFQNAIVEYPPCVCWYDEDDAIGCKS